MAVRQAASGLVEDADQASIGEALRYIRAADTDSVLAQLAPGLSAGQRDSVASHCRVAHVAVLVFPASMRALFAELRAQGMTVEEPRPSVVVRERLSRRYGVPVGGLEVVIAHVHLPDEGRGPRTVELFVLEVPPGSRLSAIAVRERVLRSEAHVALQVTTADDVVVMGLRALLADSGLVADGGGYNAVEDCTVLYFRGAVADAVRPGGWRRLELRVDGHHSAVLSWHRENGAPDPVAGMLELMTGAWTTQAIAVAARLGLADHLPGPGAGRAPDPVEAVAGRLGVDGDGLARLLRYLAAVGVVAPVGASYELTALGETLRRDAPHGLRPLALLYGGPFYRSFAALDHTVRTGREAFEVVFGAPHFEYFARRPELAALFDDAMAASSLMFEPVAGLVDFSQARVVVDVAGGSGELLSRILASSPGLRGVLVEQEHVLERARRRLTEAGCAERCAFVAGDFTRPLPAGGDVYVLSRVLHDWDDERCAVILRRCARAMEAGARLLLVERLLPDEGRASLAARWDLHMLCNVGGRERTAREYGRLLDAAGFDVLQVDELPLGAALVTARRRGPSSLCASASRRSR
ncbi:SAM-dependent methyltransferase [Streptomyces sp. R302]|uniref:methyltransferase n=1 Tax=unclassified Streptomyces TaxID=2593676 RepID=UPI00145D1785|nr:MULTISPECIES: methyltransferase [unclassified Streptomyces]NML54813.1 SAM-dependent methyltransferase [Streptomyces sp. R301]NML80618.1 SAM-dependent methyltransferase [Streptomyces sp. R302]